MPAPPPVEPEEEPSHEPHLLQEEWGTTTVIGPFRDAGEEDEEEEEIFSPVPTKKKKSPARSKAATSTEKKRKRVNALAGELEKARQVIPKKIGTKYNRRRATEYIIEDDYKCPLNCARTTLPTRVRLWPKWEPEPENWRKDAEGNPLSEEAMNKKRICDACYSRMQRARRKRLKAEQEKNAAEAKIEQEVSKRVTAVIGMTAMRNDE